jgi:hypothetical protein
MLIVYSFPPLPLEEEAEICQEDQHIEVGATQSFQQGWD